MHYASRNSSLASALPARALPSAALLPRTLTTMLVIYDYEFFLASLPPPFSSSFSVCGEVSPTAGVEALSGVRASVLCSLRLTLTRARTLTFVPVLCVTGVSAL